MGLFFLNKVAKTLFSGKDLLDTDVQGFFWFCGVGFFFFIIYFLHVYSFANFWFCGNHIF